MKNWNRLPREAVEPPSLEIPKTWQGTALSTLLCRQHCLEWGVGVDDLQRSLPTSTILWFKCNLFYQVCNSYLNLEKLPLSENGHMIRQVTALEKSGDPIFGVSCFYFSAGQVFSLVTFLWLKRYWEITNEELMFWYVALSKNRCT